MCVQMQCEEGTEWLLDLLTDVQLQQYFVRIRDELNVTRLSHFDYVKNEDLEKIGMGRPGTSCYPSPLYCRDCNDRLKCVVDNKNAHVPASLKSLRDCVDSGQRRLWEAVKRRRALYKRKSWMSKVQYHNVVQTHA